MNYQNFPENFRRAETLLQHSKSFPENRWRGIARPRAVSANRPSRKVDRLTRTASPGATTSASDFHCRWQAPVPVGVSRRWPREPGTIMVPVPPTVWVPPLVACPTIGSIHPPTGGGGHLTQGSHQKRSPRTGGGRSLDKRQPALCTGPKSDQTSEMVSIKPREGVIKAGLHTSKKCTLQIGRPSKFDSVRNLSSKPS